MKIFTEKVADCYGLIKEFQGHFFTSPRMAFCSYIHSSWIVTVELPFATDSETKCRSLNSFTIRHFCVVFARLAHQLHPT
jgi:hypothetical protein